MPNILSAYGTANQAIIITLTSLGVNAYQASTAIDNTVNLFLDALVMVDIHTHATTNSTGDRVCYVYAYGSVDGTTYTDKATGTNALLSVSEPPNLRLLGAIQAPTANVIYRGGPFSVASAFGGFLPLRWGIVVKNATGAILNGTAASFNAKYQGVYATT